MVFGGLMKKLLTMLLVCILVLSITLSLASCRRDNPEQQNPDTPTTDGGNETVEGGSGTSDGKIKLPAIKIPGLTPTPEE